MQTQPPLPVEQTKEEKRAAYLRAYREQQKANATPAELAAARKAKNEAAAARRLADPEHVRAIEKASATKRRAEKPEAVRASNKKADAKRANDPVRRAQVAAINAAWQREHRSVHATKAKRFREANADRLRDGRMTEEYRASRRAYMACRLATNPNYRFWNSQRSRLHHGLKAGKFTLRTKQLVGGTAEQAKLHIEAQFVEGMSWANHGTVWQIDHKFPLARIAHENFEHVLRASHYTNLQPLFLAENIQKRDSLVHELPPLSDEHRKLLEQHTPAPV